MRPQISVVMGVYNPKSKDELLRAVESILNQTYTDFEFIICDDGSNAQTKQWLEEIAQLDSRIRLILNSANKGLAATLNQCIAEAKGDYIARQDADDYSDIARFEKQMRFLTEHPEYGFVGTNVYYFSDDGVWGEFRYPEYPENKDFMWLSPFSHGSLIYRKEVLVRNSFYRVARETLRCEDYDLFMRIYQNGDRGANLQENLYYYCEDENTIKRRKYTDRLIEVKIRARYFGRLGLYPKGIIYLIKPVIVGLIPVKILNRMKDLYYKRNYRNRK